MFGWLKRLFSNASEDLQEGTVTNVINKTTEPAKEALKEVYEADKPKTQAKKPAKKTKSKKDSSKCDFSKLTKTQLLAEAKHRGVKANASMKKQDILDKLNAETK
jgi:hypothetical protein